MARHARIKDTFGTFLVSQNGNPEARLFRDSKDREKFVSILKKAETKYQFNLYAYCLSEDNHYDLVMDVNGSDLSSIMKSINIAYAMYMKFDGKLFRDRYKSRLIENEAERDELLTHLQCQISTTPYHQVQMTVEADPENHYFDGCVECIQCLDSAKSQLDVILDQETIESLCRDKDRRNELIKAFRKHSTLSLKELGQLFGGISESSICKIINKC